MKVPSEIAEIKSCLQYNLRKALEIFENMAIMYPETGVSIQIEEIRTDYERMVDYWKMGFEDDGRIKYYNSLVARTMQLLKNAEQRYAIMHDARLNAEYFRVRNSGRDWSVENIRKVLEMYVGEIAMTELLPENKRQVKQQQLIGEHHATLSQIFDYLRTAEQWSEATAKAMEEIFLSPTIDTLSQQTLLAAVMLNCLCWFDFQKERMMMNVYMKSNDEHVRQKALIGWILCIKSDEYKMADYENENLLGKVLDNAKCIEELQELQIQLIFCYNAEKDRNEINKNIMPDILKNSPVKIKDNTIVEIEDDAMEDIIDPEASERRMEELERKMNKMSDMLRQGHDIFYGGFSQMKRFPFFDKIMHWVMPFYKEHPYITEHFKKEDIEMFMKMMEHAPLCDSDRYSFMIALQQVMEKMPDNLKEMMQNGRMQVMGYNPGNAPEQDNPAMIRRNFLQSLYRFLRVYPGRDTFPEVFGHTKDAYNIEKANAFLFFNQPIFSAPLHDKLPQMASYCIKQGMMSEAHDIINNYGGDYDSYEACMIHGKLAPQPAMGQTYYVKALELKPGDEKAMRELARLLFITKVYGHAFEIYNTLSEKHPDNMQLYCCKLAVMVNMPEKLEEAKNALYRMTYEYPDNKYACQLLGYVLTALGKTEQAEQIYEKLLKRDDRTENDEINYGLCILAQRKYNKAAEILAKHDKTAVMEAIDKSAVLFTQNKITSLDISLFVKEML